MSGRVQGVGFRWFIVGCAERLELHGWVRNASDGSVEVECEGSPARVEQLRKRLDQGPPGARVTGVEELAAGAEQLPDGFEIRR
ncbi:MAG: acylphosphatase [Gemmatimonadota bacterium]